MKITHKIDIYLDDYRPTPEIVVMQCDANTRELQFSLYAANQPWQAPGEAKLYVSYRKPDGTGGFYDTLPDGTHACIAGDGNTVTAILAEQVLTVPGKVPVAISIQLNGAILATFSVQLRVMPNPGIGAMKSEDYFCLKAAVDAAAVAAQKPVRIITVFSSGDGKYATDHDMSMIKAMIDSNTPFVCHWYDKGIMLHLAGFQTDVAFEFTAVDDIKEYRVVITKAGVNTYVTDLAKMSDIPQKVSQLENDSGFLTTAPVTSVNGQTGEVKLPAVVKVPLIRQEDGTYKPGISHEDILAAYNAGNIVFCEYSGRLLPLIVASTALCSFGCVHSGNVYTVNITRASTVASIVPLASGGGSGSGSDGITPHIGANGNWFIGEIDTGMPSRGENGEPGSSGVYVGPGEIPEGYNIQIDPTGEAPVLVQSVNGVKPDENGNVEVPTAPDSEYTLPIATPDTLGGVKPVAKSDDMTQPVGVDELGGLWTAAGGGGGMGLETIIDFTTTEGTTEINIPIDTLEMGNKLHAASQIHIFMLVPKDDSDTETSTVGTVNIAFNVGWNESFAGGIEIIPAPTDWKGFGCVHMVYFQTAFTMDYPNPLIVTRTLGPHTYTTLSYARFYPKTIVGTVNKYICITGSQNMAAGTRFIVGVKT